MSLPAKARVEAAPNFLAGLDAILEFFRLQDVDSAPTRFAFLKAELREMVGILSWSPASGRPARFFSGRSAQLQMRSEGIRRLAEQAGLPFVREYVVGQHVVLYAHADDEVVLLAIKHQRQLIYSSV